MKSITLGSKDYPGITANIEVPDNVELPTRLEVRLPDRDYETTVLWWYYDEQGRDTRTLVSHVETSD